MKKQNFVKLINAVQAQLELDYKIAESLSLLFPHAHSANLMPNNDDFLAAVLDAVSDDMDDDFDFISHFCWECDFGKESYRLTVTDEDNKKVKFDTPEDVYDFIVELNRSKKC